MPRSSHRASGGGLDLGFFNTLLLLHMRALVGKLLFLSHPLSFIILWKNKAALQEPDYASSTKLSPGD